MKQQNITEGRHETGPDPEQIEEVAAKTPKIAYLVNICFNDADNEREDIITGVYHDRKMAYDRQRYYRDLGSCAEVLEAPFMD